MSRLRKRARRAMLPGLNVTPLVDVLIILVALLMMASLMSTKQLPVDMPQTSISGAPALVSSLQVNVMANGTLSVDAGPLTLDEVLDRVDGRTSVELYADKQVTYDQLAQLVGRLQQKTPASISLMTR